MIKSSLKRLLFRQNTNNNSIDELMKVAIEKHRLGNFDEAEINYRQILKLQPGHSDCLHHLGVLESQKGNYESAFQLINQAIDANPHVPDYYMNLGRLLLEQHRLEEAVVALEHALQLNSEIFDAYKLIGIALKGLWQLDDAKTAFKKAIAIKSDSADIHDYLGLTLHLSREFDEAKSCFEKAININPDYVPAYNNLAAVHTAQGNFEKARDAYEKALHLYPDNPHSIAGIAQLKKFNKDDLDFIDKAEFILNTLGEHDSNLRLLHFALGKMLDDCGEYDRAFFHFEQANLLNREEYNLDLETEERKVSVMIDTFSPELFEQYKDFGEPSKLPVFIVGMPRSGTSLVEQIIASHPEVYGAGELTHIGNLSKTLHNYLETDNHYPECILDLDKDTIELLASEYLSELKNYSSNAIRITDKMPANFVHLGLISILFPQAYIIHCKRDPMDICLSMYFNNMAGPQGYALNLSDLGYWYLQYERLMQHWKECLPVPILDINYDDLINNQQNASRQLIEFIELDWDDQCISFHKTNRTVLTASNWQVKQPLYKTSLNRWKNYEKHLEPLKKILEYKS